MSMFKHLLKGFSVRRIGKKAIAFVSPVSAVKAMKVSSVLSYDCCSRSQSFAT
jgi:hypothetical protein